MQGSLDLSELLHLFVRKLWLIVLVSVVGVLAAFGVTKLMLTPQYTSSVQLYVSSSQSEQPITLNDINTAQKLVNTYTVIVQSDTVLEKVIAAVPLDCTTAQLRKALSVSSVNNTEVMLIKVTTDDAQLSAEIANKIAEIAPESIIQITKAGYVELVDSAKPSTSPSSPNTKMNCVLGFLLGLVASVLFVVIQEMLDTRVKGEEDLKKYYNVPVLGEIPNFESQFKGGYERK